MKRSRLLLFLPVLAAACQDQPPDDVISQFERPQNVTLVCWEGDTAEGGPVALSACRDASITGERTVLAFVTQTTPGEVAVINLDVRRAVDEDKRIPYASFVPVGGMPTGIASTEDGKLVISANAETSDLSLIDVRHVFDGVVSPSVAVDLEGSPSHIVVVRVAGSDYAFVTLPWLHRLAVVRLIAPEGESESPSGTLLGWLEFAEPSGEEATDSAGDTSDEKATDSGSDTDTETSQQHDLPSLAVPTLDGAAFAPKALTATAQSLLVGAANAAVIVEVDLGVLVQRAESLAVPGNLSDDALVRSISLEGALRSFTTAELAVEPGETPRWLYAVENELGGLLAIDLVEGLLVEANAGDRKAADPESIALPGRAIAIELVSAAEKGDAYDPLTFDGTFAVASTTMAAIYVLDVHDRKADPDFNAEADPALFNPHTIRSRANLGKEPDSDDTDTTGQRYLVDAPAVVVGDQSFVGDNAADYLYFEGGVRPEGDETSSDTATDISTDKGTATEFETNTDTDSQEQTDTQTEEGTNEDALPEGFVDGGDLLPGFAVREDPREWVRDDWSLTYQGAIGISGGAVADFESMTDALGGEKAAVVVFDDTKDFCAMGLRAGRGVDGEPKGDLFVVTSAPTPDPKNAAAVKTCADTYGKDGERHPTYQVARVLDAHTLIIVNNGSDPSSPFEQLVQECYGQVFSYEIRAADHYILNGATTGHLYTPGTLDTDSQLCIMPDDSDGRRQRVFVGERFSNYYFSFILREGPMLPGLWQDARDDTDPNNDNPTVSLSFSTAGGFAPLSYVLGNRMTDIATMPDGTLVIIDQAAPALVTFDMLGDFAPTFEAIN